MWGTCGVLPGYILSMYHTYFPYISMEIMLNFDLCTRRLEDSYTDNMNISQKFALSSTWGKLSRLLKVILCGATGCQRKYLMHFFRYFSNKQEKWLFFYCGHQTRSMAVAQKLTLLVYFFDI